jgi:spermidine synthase
MTTDRDSPTPIPPEFEEADRTCGTFEDGWYIEEDVGISRLGIRVRALLHQETSPYQTIAVYDSDFFGRFLTLDGLMMFTERDEFVYHEMLVHVPLGALSSPESVLIIGGGDCGCLREALAHPGIRRVVLCELDERVTRVCEDWFPWVGPSLQDPRSEIVFTDGSDFIRQEAGSFDLVLVDSTDPVGPAAELFLRDFYARVAGALKPGGVMTAQIGSPHWSPRQVGAVLREQREAFTSVRAYAGQVPTYQSGTWCWSFATNGSLQADSPDPVRADRVAEHCRYYNRPVHRAAFALPNFARQAIRGVDPFPHRLTGRKG